MLQAPQNIAQLAVSQAACSLLGHLASFNIGLSFRVCTSATGNSVLDSHCYIGCIPLLGQSPGLHVNMTA